jgi:hypothetical protein
MARVMPVSAPECKFAPCIAGQIGYLTPMDDKKPQNNVPLPPDEEKPVPVKEPPSEKPDPTRFGDWERNGRCIDF